MIALIVLVFLLLGLFDLPRLIRQKCWREATVCAVLLLTALTLTLLLEMDIRLPNPVRNSQYIVKWLFEQIHLTYD